MFGKGNWQKADATIIARKFGAGKVVYTHFVADVKPAQGDMFRCELTRPAMTSQFWEPYPGDVVGVEFDPKNNKARFDMSDPRLNAKKRLENQKDDFKQVLSQAPGTTPDKTASATPEGGGAPLDPELEELMRREEEERGAGA